MNLNQYKARKEPKRKRKKECNKNQKIKFKTKRKNHIKNHSDIEPIIATTDLCNVVGN